MSSTHKMKFNKTLTTVECTRDMKLICSKNININRMHTSLCRIIGIMNNIKEKILITTNKSINKCFMIHFLTISSSMETLGVRMVAQAKTKSQISSKQMTITNQM